MTNPADRQRILTETRNLKMAQPAHAYVRDNTVKFYDWLENSSRGKLPEGPRCMRQCLPPVMADQFHGAVLAASGSGN